MAVDVVLIKLGEVNLEIEGVYIKPRAGVATLDNGDPGYPDEPSDFEVLNVFYMGVDVSDLLSETNLLTVTPILPGSAYRHKDIWEVLSEKCVEEYEK